MVDGDTPTPQFCIFDSLHISPVLCMHALAMAGVDPYYSFLDGRSMRFQILDGKGIDLRIGGAEPGALLCYFIIDSNKFGFLLVPQPISVLSLEVKAILLPVEFAIDIG
jgi:hypothetical protein